VNKNALVRHQLRNLLHSALLVTSLALALGLLAWCLAGQLGAFVAVGLALGLWLLTPRLSPSLVLGLVKARQLAPGELFELQELTRVLAERAGLPRPPALWIQPGERANAFAVGTREQGAIALSSGLVRRLSVRELAGVLAHELSHLAHGDTRLMGFADLASRLTASLASIGQLALLLLLPAWLLGLVTVPWLTLVVLLVAPLVSALAQLALARTREFDADRSAVELLGSPEPLAEALQRLEWHQRRLFAALFGRHRHLPETSLLRTHPSTEERLARLGELGSRSRPSPRPHARRADREQLWAALCAPAVRGPQRLLGS